jgi:ubiquinone/menaquinone biosynthesis C-methylase UbiE|tara:strand:+ start:351 stop:1007 length:657 start_codon:yes stop_codon:yes gene_type:complete
MGKEIDLLKRYPVTKRDLKKRLITKSPEDRRLARKFGYDFFDGDRKNGYGGYYYNPRFWNKVVKDFIKFYKLNNKSKILDIGCGKGFMLHDFKQAIPKSTVRGIDISSYAINNSLLSVKEYLKVGNAKKLVFPDNYFDLSISITTLHNLNINDFKKSINEIKRVSKKSFITVDSYKNELEKKRMDAWNLTAQTYMHRKDWIKLFKEINYNGDYYWFIP